MVPIVDHVLRHGSRRGIQAIVVYPMNALANSQLGELDKFLSVGILRDLFTFPIDMLPVAAEPNRLNDQVLVRYYENEWKVIAR